MMPIAQITKMVGKTLSDNSPAILTGLAVTGVATTAIFAAKAGYKTGYTVAEAQRAEDENNEPMPSNKDLAKELWKDYIPTAAIGVATVSCVVGATAVGSRRTAALAGAYTLTERAFKEYQAKVVETIGETRDRTIRDEIAKDRLDRNPVSKAEVIITGNGDVLCYDSLTGRYFQSSIEKIRRAENDLNFQILDEGYASQNELYAKIGLDRVRNGDDLGWRYEGRLDISFTTSLSDDGRPCVVLNYGVEPIRNYYKGH